MPGFSTSILLCDYVNLRLQSTTMAETSTYGKFIYYY